MEVNHYILRAIAAWYAGLLAQVADRGDGTIEKPLYDEPICFIRSSDQLRDEIGGEAHWSHAY
ncbi:hypothetical protein SS05631_c14300 [Sinorhizobium sp. CCBAU 05631]|nr:hypothetical protein SS05631_c14300 [Sinorhizobium sp. CCBAU 05631]